MVLGGLPIGSTTDFNPSSSLFDATTVFADESFMVSAAETSVQRPTA
jgi:hypothetical protein